jgi:hypothetical protein
MAGSILLPIISIFQGKGVKDATDQLGKLGGAVGGVKKLLGGLGAATIAKGAFDFVKDSAIKARNYERELRALKTIFGSSAPTMEKFAKDSAKIGLSTAESAKASVFLGSVLKQSGFTMGKVTDETKKLVSLASDLATVYGYDVSEALSGMTALFRGEYDPIEKFGVAMKQAEVNALLLERGQKNLTGSALRQAQAQARLDLLYQRSADSQGAFAKGQGTLFVEQRNLSVAFENFQAQIAQALIPVLADMMALIGDFVTRNGPLLTKVFESFGKIIQTVFNELSADQDILDKAVRLFVDLTKVLSFFAEIIVKHIASIVLLGISYGVTIGAMKIWQVLMPILTASTYLTSGAVTALSYAFDMLKVKAAMATAGITLAVGFIAVQSQSLIDFARSFDEVNAQLDKYGRARSNFKDNGALVDEKDLTDMQKELKFLTQINNEYRNRAYLRGERIKAQYALAAAARAEAADAAEQFAKEMAAYRAGFKDLISAVDPIAYVSRTMGQFEQAVSSSFRAIYEKIHNGLSEGFLIGTAHDALIAYVKDEASALATIARNRDKWAARYSLAKTLIADTTKTVQEFASLNNLLTDTGREMTKTISYMVGDIQISTTETVKSVGNAATILEKYQSIVDATKKFSENVSSLDKLGLSTGLLQQIVAGGLDQGAALAEGIVAGGPDAVKAMNDSFQTLTDLGSQLGTTVATTLYGDGVDMSNGLLAGLLSVEEEFANAGQTLADSFQKSFDTVMGLALSGKVFKIPTIDTSALDALIAKYGIVDGTSGSGGSGGTGGTGGPVSKLIGSGAGGNQGMLGLDTSGINPYAGQQYSFGAGGVPQQVIVNVTVTPGVVTDPVAIGGKIVEYIKTYGRTNKVAF